MELSNPSAFLSSYLVQSAFTSYLKTSAVFSLASLSSISLALILLKHKTEQVPPQVFGSFPSLLGRIQHVYSTESLSGDALDCLCSLTSCWDPLHCSQTYFPQSWKGLSCPLTLSKFSGVFSTWTLLVPFSHSANLYSPFRYLFTGQSLPEDLPACSLFFSINNLNKYLSSG